VKLIYAIQGTATKVGQPKIHRM